MKDEMISKIKSSLKDLGIETIDNPNTDIEINKDFLDAEFSGGKKKVNYHALAYIDDEENRLNYYEATSETSSGLSMGSFSESYSQHGTNLSRKIKSTTYGLKGEVIELELDLKEIKDIFKNTAEENDYKFKIVITKSKAMSPNAEKGSFFSKLFK